MKWLRVFSVFVLLHGAAWAGTHFWLRQHPKTELIVVDTSFSLKPEFADMLRWIDNHADNTRYRKLVVATDKAMIGPLEDIRDRQSIFRTAFGHSSAGDLLKYAQVNADRRYWLSDDSFSPEGWTVITFP